MKRLRFSLIWLLGLVALVALACASLRSATELWGSATFTLMLGVLFVALVAVFFSRREASAFWAGFALCGWGYMLLVFGPWFKDNVSANLLTTKILDYAHPKLHPPAAPPLAGNAAYSGWTTGGTAVQPGWSGGMNASDVDGDGVLDLYVTNGFANITSTAFAAPAVATTVPQVFFHRVGHSWWALLLSITGGVAARRFYDKQTRPEQPNTIRV